MTRSGEERVLVVGGGLAGITAALSLADAGFKVTLVEARRYLGGRVGSFYDRETDRWVDFCQHVGMHCCANLRWLIDRLEQREQWEVQRDLHFYTANGEYLQARGWPCPAPFHLAGLLWKWPDLKFSDRIAVGLAMLALRKLPMDRRASWSKRLALDWLIENKQSTAAIRSFWVTILTSALGEQIERVTLGATHKVLVDGFMAQRDAYHLLVPKQPLSRLIGEDAKIALERSGVEVRTENGVDQLLWTKGKVSGVRFRHGGECEGRAVVVAVPWHAIARIFESANSEVSSPSVASTAKPSMLESAPITGVHTWWDRPWLPTPHAILIHRLCQWVFPGPREVDSASRLGERETASEHYYQVVISGSRDLPKGDPTRIQSMIERDLKEVFPACRNSQLLRAKVVTDPNAVFSVSPQHEEGRLSSDLLCEHHIWLAGDWVDTGWPATMESAILSGRTAAKQCVAKLAHASG